MWRLIAASQGGMISQVSRNTSSFFTAEDDDIIWIFKTGGVAIGFVIGRFE